ncbi:MAG TPA: hypothetical protein VN377_06070, partial [Candidatus Thermoplasmatota archaeon]|nr:hypothetical protein [Candidatus Thermoplasmatota archaeon]
KIIILTVLLIGSLMITPALASTTQAEYQTKLVRKNSETITVEFIDVTGAIPVKKEITMTRAEWNTINNELQAVATTEKTMSGKFAAQLSVFQNHHLVSEQTSIDALLAKFDKRTNHGLIRSLLERVPKSLPINNSIFSALSAITFTLENENGSTMVFGLNTFINFIGFNIVSVHKGYAPNGIQTNGLISDSVPPGEYAGFIFGFFGYWFGEKISTGVYSNLTVAGLGIITAWLPVP